MYTPWAFVVAFVVAGWVLTIAPEITELEPASVTVPVIVPVAGAVVVVEVTGLVEFLHAEKNIRRAATVISVLEFI